MSPRARAKAADCGCEIADVMRLLGRSHVLPLLYLFHESPGPRRFVELQAALGISPNTLSERLRDLVESGLLTRTAYNEIPPRVDYDVTAKAKELALIFRSLVEWCRKHDLEPVPATKASA